MKIYIVEFFTGDGYENSEWTSDIVFKSKEKCIEHILKEGFVLDVEESFVYDYVKIEDIVIDPIWARIKELQLV